MRPKPAASLYWAQARNLQLLPEEKPFSSTFDELSLTEMDFWLSRFVLEVRKANGDSYPPNSLCQLVCGLQWHLRNHGHANVKLFEDPALHGFRSTLDEEMKRLNATGNYVNKKTNKPLRVRRLPLESRIAWGPQCSSYFEHYGVSSRILLCSKEW